MARNFGPYVIAGPRRIGNCFGVFGHDLADGTFAVVEDGEYANGGFGPSQAGQLRLYASRDEAEAALAELRSAVTPR